MSSSDIIQIIYGALTLIVLCVTAYFISHAPVNAVNIGRQLNTEQQKDNAKRNLFLLLFALRGSPSNYDFVKGLNQIDIVYEDSPLVRAAWHKHYKDLHDKTIPEVDKVWNIGRVEVLSQMAQSLGYGSLKASDILENYYPEGHQYQENYYFDFQQAHLTYLKSGAALHQMLIENASKQQSTDSNQTA